jgi:hypothetical protein
MPPSESVAATGNAGLVGSLDNADLRTSVARTRIVARAAMALVAALGALQIAEHVAASLTVLEAQLSPGPVPTFVSHLRGPRFLLQVVTTVVYCRWLYRAYVDHERLGGAPLPLSPRDAVLAWFLPVINFYRPYQALRDLHAKGDPATVPATPEYRPAAVTEDYRTNAREELAPRVWDLSFPVRGWWGFYVIGPLVFEAAYLACASTGGFAVPSDFQYLPLVRLPMIALATIFGIQVIRSIDARQHERLRRLLAKG